MNRFRRSEKDKFLSQLQEYFTLDELKSLCFYFDIDFENIVGTTKRAKCQELFNFFGRHNRFADLIDYVNEKRPNVQWPDPDTIPFGGYYTINADEELAAVKAYRRRAAGEEIAKVTESITLEPRNRLRLNGKIYVVRNRLLQKNAGAVVIHSARASDITLKRDVGICRIETLVQTNQTKVLLGQVMQRAQTYSRAVPQARQLPHLYEVIDKSPTAVWLIMQWLNGESLATHLARYNSRPDEGKCAQLLGWLADICGATAALHRQKQSPTVISRHTIVLPSRGRGAFLIDPLFSDQPHLATIQFPTFDPKRDVRQLASELYQMLTHQSAQSHPASFFNPALPSKLDETLQNALDGRIKNAHTLKRAFLQIKHNL